MLISYDWLKEFIELKETPEEVARILTALGFESAVRPANSGFSGIVVAKVVSKVPHPAADKLSLCEVSDGTATYKVVCGAPNVEAGQIVPLAKIGATVGDVKIKKAKLRGVESEGMICSERELAIAAASEGIMTLSMAEAGRLGRDFAELYPPDFIIEVEPLPNRPDILSHYGVAMELSAKLNRPVKAPSVAGDKISPDGRLADVEPHLLAGNTPGCESYTAVALDDVSVAESPERLKNRLRLCGYRPINAAVDITNYVMAEMGHPLHAFDRDKLSNGKVIVRAASTGEKIKALDGKTYDLGEGDIVIADGAGAACAIAGIIGGETSAVSSSTKRIVLESAVFNPQKIFSTRRRLKISTESSYRFERGMSKSRSLTACLRAVELLKTVCSARPSAIVNHGSGLPKNKIAVFFEKIRSHTGVNIVETKVRGILAALSFEIVREEKDFIVVEPPSFRRDIFIQEDVIEEIIRVFGYDNARFDSAPAAMPDESFAVDRRRFDFVSSARRFLASAGFVENVNCGMIAPEWFSYFDEKLCVKIINPVSPEAAALRPSLFCQMWECFTANLGEGHDSQMIYETGNIFYDGAQTRSLGLLASGNVFGDNWKKASLDADFYFLKGILEKLSFFACKDIRPKFVADSGATKPSGGAKTSDFLAFGINIISEEGHIGRMGPVATALALAAGAKSPVWWIELNVDMLSEKPRRNLTHKQYSVFPASSMDFSLMVDAGLDFENIKEHILRIMGDDAHLTESVAPTDVWKPPSGETSVLVRITLRHPSKTLDAAELGAMHGKIASGISRIPGLKLRT